MTTDPADVLRPLRRTRQIREFEPTPLEPAVLDALVDVARWSGSSQNSQPWRHDPGRRWLEHAQLRDGRRGDRDLDAERSRPRRS